MWGRQRRLNMVAMSDICLTLMLYMAHILASVGYAEVASNSCVCAKQSSSLSSYQLKKLEMPREEVTRNL